MFGLSFTQITHLGAGIAGAILIGLVGFALHTINVAGIKAKHAGELVALETKLKAECEADKKITTEVSHDYQTKIADLNRKLSAAKRVRPSVCVPVTGPATGHDATSGTGEPVRKNGVASDELLDFAAEAEQYRLQLEACQSFVLKVWDAKTGE